MHTVRFQAAVWLLVSTIFFAVMPSRAVAEGGLPSSRAYEVVSPVSQEFVQTVDSALATVPAPIQDRMRRSGWRVQLAGFVTDAAPHLRGVHPRGWPRQLTWEHTDAVNLPDRRVVVIAEKRRNTKGAVRIANRVGGVLRHETGHAFDLANATRHPCCSQRPEFRASYARDVARMTAADRRTLAYYLQGNSVGRQELFAEAFAILLGGGSDPSHRAEIERAFPSAIECVRRQLAPLRAGRATR